MKSNPTTPSFCWRSSWLYPLESTWCTLRKFAFYNQASADQLHYLFARGRGLIRLKGTRCDLREYGRLDPARLALVFQVDETVLGEGTVRPFVGDEEFVLLSSAKLRFCHSCLKEGFHSSLHQVLLVSHCPLHDEALTTRCQYCETSFDYSLNTVRIVQKRGCRNCIGPLQSARETREQFSVVPPAREGKFRMTAMFLRSRLDGPRAHYCVSSWISPKRTPRARQHQISRLASYSRQLVNGSSELSTSLESYSCFEYPCRQSLRQTTPKLATSNGRYQVGSSLDRELFSIVKSIRRQLERLWLRLHRSCVNSLVRLGSSAPAIWRGIRCPYANVLLLWRLYWEDVDEIHRLGVQYRKQRRNGIEWPVNWRPLDPDLPTELVRRVFAIEALGVLEECYVLVKTLRRRNQHTFSRCFVKEVAGRRMPYWIVERLPDDGCRLHVWKGTPRRRSWREITFAGGTARWGKDDGCAHTYSDSLDRQFGSRTLLLT
jgi:hypothetical protein